VFFDSFFAAAPSPLVIDPQSPEAAIVRFHDTACEGILRALEAREDFLRSLLEVGRSSGAGNAEAWTLLAPGNPHFPEFLGQLLAGCCETRAAIVRAASLAEFLQVIDEALAAFAGLAINRFGTADPRRTAARLAPVLVHVAGLADPAADPLLGAGVLPKVAGLVTALEADNDRPFQPFYQVFLAWKTDPARRLLAPPDHDGAVSAPFTTLARTGVVIGGVPGTLTAALRTNLLVIESVEKSDDDLTPAELRYLRETSKRYAAEERDAAIARDRLAAWRTAANEPPAAEPARPPVCLGPPPPGSLRPELLDLLLRSFAVLCVLDRKVNAAEIWSVLEPLHPLGLDLKDLHDRFIEACRTVHHEGAAAVARVIADELRAGREALAAAGIVPAGLWEALEQTGRAGGDQSRRKDRVLAEMHRALVTDRRP